MMYGGEERIVMTILLVYLLIGGVLLLGYLASYILKGIGMYTLGKNRGMENPWLAFIPYARVWFQGELCGELSFKEKKIRNPGIWMLLIPIVSNVMSGAVLAVLWVVFAVNIFSSMQGYGPSMFSGSGVGLLVLTYIILLLVLVLTAAVRNTLLVIVNHQIFARYTDKNYALVHAVAGVFLPLYTSIYFFIIRNRE